ncbi:hypothetical protein TNIN_140271 [Trichonephila inaurata madagascariensis]|uniref:Uncharacterized protein n=1 Tax=Trichonephila inaurata madagascariensis TaxID=2747483 RepID=A0A8X7C320_9ARAC|nr:hypothetical protein TNIN_140271 [Trichonephila inaurata madagascariensis]
MDIGHKTVTDTNTCKQELKISSCFLCTNRGLYMNNCHQTEKAFCYKCKKKKVHYAFTRKTVTKNPNLTTTPVTSTNNIDIKTPKLTHLETARVVVHDLTGKTKKNIVSRRQWELV